MGLTGNWDGRISRRTLLRTGGSAAAGLLMLSRTTAARAVPPFDGNPFSLGVASGDPTPSGIVLWTRLAPDPLADGGGLPQQAFGVRYEVAADEGFGRIVRRGAVEAVPEEAHTVHAEVTGLQPATTYWYRFKFGTTVTPPGRTRTAPAAGSAVDSLTFAFVSCQNFAHGYYPAYADIAGQEDLELVVHLGDYIYEGPGIRQGNVRVHFPAAELFSLADYRFRHAQYKTDKSLQAAHRAHPFLMTWDDHEFKDNYADLDLDPDEPLETVAARRAAAYLAYWEHSPLARSRKPVGKDMNLYRRAQWGDVATFHVLDTRQHRSDQMAAQCTRVDRHPETGYYCPTQLDASRTILGAEQRDWLFAGLAAAPAGGWNVLANQVGFAAQDINNDAILRRYSPDSWDGYVADRQRVLDFLAEKSLSNTLVITGDKHYHSVRDVAESYVDLTGTPIATEFIGSSISSVESGNPMMPGTSFGGDADNPHIKFENHQRGYVSVTLDHERCVGDYRVVDALHEDSPVTSIARAEVLRAKPGAVVTPVTAA